MQRKWLALIGAFLIGAFALIVAFQSWMRPPSQTSAMGQEGKAKGRGKAERTVAVEAAIARGAKTTTDIRAIGSLRSDESVQVASEIAGRIEKINFKEGQAVAEG